MKNSQTFCVMPFIHQNIKQEGKVSACWRYPDRIGDYRNQTLEEIWNSVETRTLRKSLTQSERPKGCRSCWDFEDSNVVSTRQTCNETYQKKYKIDIDNIISKLDEDFSLPYEPKTIEIRFDNTCNFRCRHCSPTYSSQWESLAFKNTDVKTFFIKHGAGRLEKKHINLPEDRFEEFKRIIPHLKEVLIAGGEPLQQKKHWEMIEAMEEYSKNITLSYNSNLSSLGISKYSVLDYWPKFQKIILRVSIDGDEDTFSYFRTNGILNIVKSNIEKLHCLNNLEMSVTTTVSIYNISRLPSIVKYINSCGGFFHTSIVQYPKPINPKVLPKVIKDKITLEWEQFKLTLNEDSLWSHKKWEDQNNKMIQLKRIKQYGDYAVNYMNAEDYSDSLPETEEYVLFMDNLNNTSFKEIYPELAGIFKK